MQIHFINEWIPAFKNQIHLKHILNVFVFAWCFSHALATDYRGYHWNTDRLWLDARSRNTFVFSGILLNIRTCCGITHVRAVCGMRDRYINNKCFWSSQKSFAFRTILDATHHLKRICIALVCYWKSMRMI